MDLSSATGNTISSGCGNNSNNNSSAGAPIPIIDISSWTNRTTTTVNNETILNTEQIAVVDAIHKACCDIGFFIITGHKIDEHIIQSTLDESRSFFDLPLEIKLLSKTNDEKVYPYGYEHSENLQRGKKKNMTPIHDGQQQQEEGNGIHEQQLSSPSHDASAVGTADLKETFSIGPSNPLSGMPQRRFPTTSLSSSSSCNDTATTNFQTTLELYYTEMERLATILFQIFAKALQLNDINWFVTNKFDHHCSALRILNYPKLVLPIHDKVGHCLVRASAHTDYGAFTILYSGGPGLQVKKDMAASNTILDRHRFPTSNINNHKQQPPEHDWIDVPDIKNAFIINLGDLMPRWTNDKWVSTLHRVIAVPTATTISATNDDDNLRCEKQQQQNAVVVERRQSVAFFCNVNGDTLIETIETCIQDDDGSNNPNKYQPIIAMEHLMSKHLASMSAD